jgi:cytochrome c oxidase subunit 4
MAEQELQTATPHESAHPSPAKYILIAIYLTLITIFEVLIYYVEALEAYFLWIFLALSALKFYYVAMFYMHLKFDAKIFKSLFIFGMVLATFIMFALLLLFSIIV